MSPPLHNWSCLVYQLEKQLEHILSCTESKNISFGVELQLYNWPYHRWILSMHDNVGLFSVNNRRPPLSNQSFVYDNFNLLQNICQYFSQASVSKNISHLKPSRWQYWWIIEVFSQRIRSCHLSFRKFLNFSLDLWDLCSQVQGLFRSCVEPSYGRQCKNPRMIVASSYFEEA